MVEFLRNGVIYYYENERVNVMFNNMDDFIIMR